jgi:uncharacterized membrane protein YfhO
MITHGNTQSVLRLRLSNVPGWHATIDGKQVDLTPFAGVMLQVRVPPGRHVVALHYWPSTFPIGILVALGALSGLVVLLVFSRTRSRRPVGPGAVRDP